MSNLELKDGIDDLLLNIKNDIDEIDLILENINKAILTLTEAKWNTKEKRKFDEEFKPYIKKISEGYPDYLRNRLQFIQESVQKHRNDNTQIEKSTEELL